MNNECNTKAGEDRDHEMNIADELFNKGDFVGALNLYSKHPEDRHSKLRMGKMYLMGWGTNRRPLKGYALLQESLDKADPESLYELGRCRFEGIGTNVDKDNGFELLMLSAEAEYAPAEDMVGEIYAEGSYDGTDNSEAMKWFNRAVKHGSARGNYHIALMYKRGEYDDVEVFIKNMTIAADARIPEAVGELGYRYYHGDDVEKDEEKGLSMLEYAADHGETRAAMALGSIFSGDRFDTRSAKKYLKMALKGGDENALPLLGDIYRRNRNTRDKAIDCYRKASEKGDVRCIRECANLLMERGKGTDLPEGFRMFKKAAEMGDSTSMGEVGYCYMYGIGVCEDKNEAYKWFHTGADKEDGFSKYKLAEMYDKGITVKKSHDIAKRLLKESFENGFVRAAYNLGLIYEYNDPISIPEAIYWYKQGAEAGDEASMGELAKHYESGSFIKGSDEKAFDLYKKAYDVHRDSEYAAELGKCYQEGIGVDVDLDKAIEYYNEASCGNGFAMRRLYEIYRDQSGLDDIAVFWLRRSADSGVMVSMKELAGLYENGDKVHQSYELAMKWYHSAAEKGDEFSKKRFEELLYEDNDDKETDDEYLSLAYKIGECCKFDGIIEMAGRLFEGRGVPRDVKKAKMWLDIGCRYRVAGADEMLAKLNEVKE